MQKNQAATVTILIFVGIVFVIFTIKNYDTTYKQLKISNR